MAAYREALKERTRERVPLSLGPQVSATKALPCCVSPCEPKTSEGRDSVPTN